MSLTCKVSVRKLLHELSIHFIAESPKFLLWVPHRPHRQLLVQGHSQGVVSGADGKVAVIKLLNVENEGSSSLDSAHSADF